ncbi:arylesterase [Acinetobacter sp. KAM398]|nr:arylesterase [Acinetobacter sp. KAM392]GJC32841.1 arylesterase [Acinetobacter sp. KAM393]GJC35670.1 arylesterase [Acinetobacter sp. KAM394]GJC38755.1 arylesterase [Acinetobacter sp. KAM395]GJC41580.1 arylesterase [Acinetobacter sp. KAM396]GJC44130.1 arylesterase [Acinetobacter sp. KAM397]GJC46958.1 arylesterase [Acinetobacter sp. KAM398]GJC50341.1 arylesterase [Acinetobacter sp. KAM399]GJC52895.1 arylesterase [Acinetobacter sp. KAM400]GJC55423.1 arylesterase [Acinetobacter sp. KAM401]G
MFPIMQNRNLTNRVFPRVLLLGLCFSPFVVSAKTIMIVGDSLSAGYGIQPQQGWVLLLQKRLEQQYPKEHKVVNASVSGETTSGALARLPKLLQTHRPDVVVIELGGNDGLRGQPPQMIQKNLANLIQHSQKAKAKVVIFGMKMPPNYGSAYSKAFENNYKVVSQQYKVKLLPFFLEGVAGNKQLMQKDLIHPNAKAQPILLNNAYPYIKGAL